MNPFHNRTAPKKRDSSSTFAAPTKEEATTGRFMAVGDDYGVGYAQNIGSKRVKSYSEGPIPLKSFCSDPDEI